MASTSSSAATFSRNTDSLHSFAMDDAPLYCRWSTNEASVACLSPTSPAYTPGLSSCLLCTCAAGRNLPRWYIRSRTFFHPPRPSQLMSYKYHSARMTAFPPFGRSGVSWLGDSIQLALRDICSYPRSSLCRIVIVDALRFKVSRHLIRVEAATFPGASCFIHKT